MKKTAKFTALVLAAVAALGVIAACGGAGEYELLENAEKVVAVKALKTNEQATFGDVLTELKEEGALDFEGTTGDTGLYITSLNGYTPDYAQTKEFWAVFTTLKEYGGTTYSDAVSGTYDYNGTTLFSAVYGVSALPLVEGELYIMAIAVSNF